MSKVNFRPNTIAGAKPDKRTLLFGGAGGGTIVGLGGPTVEPEVPAERELGHETTLAHPQPPAAPPDPNAPTADLPAATGPGGRTTVLPKLVLADGEVAPSLQPSERPRYSEQATLGVGGIGEVSLALDEDIGRAVAIKRLRNGVDSATLMRFVDEVQVMGLLDHPNIVPVHDVGCDQHGRLFFVMKRMDGDTLESIIERLRDGDPETHAQYPLTVRVEVMMGILRAVQFAHAKRVVHRDIKPSNVMIGKFGEVALMDWGIAKRVDDPLSAALDQAAPPKDEDASLAPARRAFRTRVGALLGTPAYMSPEQARGDNHLIDERSDVFSLAVLFYELMTLTHPFEHAATLADLLEAVRTHEAKPASSIRQPLQGGIPQELSNFIERGMCKQREGRFASVGEMIEELHLINEGNFAVTCPVTLLKSILAAASRGVDKYPMLAASSVVLFVLAVIVTLVWSVVRLVA